MGLLLSLAGNWRTWALLGYVALAGWGTIQTWRLGYTQDRVEAITATFEAFKAQVAAMGEIAQQRAATQAALDRQRKEKADADRAAAKVKIDGLYAAYSSLRDTRAGSGGGILPSPGPATADPARADFDRRALDRALSGFDRSVTDLLRTGDEAIVDLDAAKLWAQSR